MQKILIFINFEIFECVYVIYIDLQRNDRAAIYIYNPALNRTIMYKGEF